MVSNGNKATRDSRINQGVRTDIPQLNKIGASTPFDFEARNLTAYGGLLPVAAMLEKLGFQQLVEETLTVSRKTRSMPMFKFILGMILACYVGFSRLNHLRFLKCEPMLTGILGVRQLPPQSTFWRFLAALHLGVARQLLSIRDKPDVLLGIANDYWAVGTYIPEIQNAAITAWSRLFWISLVTATNR
jgi:hypothetical protein